MCAPLQSRIARRTLCLIVGPIRTGKFLYLGGRGEEGERGCVLRDFCRNTGTSDLVMVAVGVDIVFRYRSGVVGGSTRGGGAARVFFGETRCRASGTIPSRKGCYCGRRSCVVARGHAVGLPGVVCYRSSSSNTVGIGTGFELGAAVVCPGRPW